MLLYDKIINPRKGYFYKRNSWILYNRDTNSLDVQLSSKKYTKWCEFVVTVGNSLFNVVIFFIEVIPLNGGYIYTGVGTTVDRWSSSCRGS